TANKGEAGKSVTPQPQKNRPVTVHFRCAPNTMEIASFLRQNGNKDETHVSVAMAYMLCQSGLGSSYTRSIGYVMCGMHPYFVVGAQDVAESKVEATLEVIRKTLDKAAKNGFGKSRVTDSFDNFCLKILAQLLTGGPNSPFHQSLIESGLGSSYTRSIGYVMCGMHPYFVVGAQDVAESKVEATLEVIRKTLDKAAKNGFGKSRVNAILHGIELDLKHQDTGFGLKILNHLVFLWHHQDDPLDALQINALISKFRKIYQDNPRLLQDFVTKYLVRSTHHVIAILTPDSKVPGKRAEFERRLVQKKHKEMDEIERERYMMLLRHMHDKVEDFRTKDTSSLPILHLGEIEPDSQSPNQSFLHKKIQGVPVQYSVQPTNGLTYFAALINCNDLPAEFQDYVPLFARCVTKLGAGDWDFKALSRRIDTHTGGLSGFDHLRINPKDSEEVEEGVLFYSFSLNEDAAEMFNILTKIFLEFNPNSVERIRSLLKQEVSSFMSSLVHRGNTVAKIYASKTLGISGRLKERYVPGKRAEFERRLVQKKHKEMDEIERERYMMLLRHMHDKVEDFRTKDTSSLPILHLGEIEPDSQSPNQSFLHKKIQGVPVQYSVQPTNGLTYFAALINCNDLPAEFQDYVPLFARCVTKLGAGDWDFKALSRRIDTHTGGLSGFDHLRINPKDSEEVEEGVLFYSFSLNEDAAEMFNILTKIFLEFNPNSVERIRSLYFVLQSLLETQERLQSVVGVFSEMSRHILSKKQMRCCLNTSADFMPSALGLVESFLKKIGGKARDSFARYKKSASGGFQPKSQRVNLVVPLNTNFTALAFPGVPPAHDDYAALQILAKILQWRYLMPEIRLKNSAYAAGVALNEMPNVFCLWSYRDPVGYGTFKAFKKAISWVTKEASFTDEDIHEAKLTVFQEEDRPVPPGEAGLDLFLKGMTPEMRSKHRKQLLGVTKNDILRVADKYLRQRFLWSSTNKPFF
ncbi:unnamed protein product, partial [Notodromas monacha]